MLDLNDIVRELPSVAEETRLHLYQVSQQLTAALRVARTDTVSWSRFQDTINQIDSKLMTARIISHLPVCTVIEPQSAPLLSTVLAVDGSQISLDRHSAIPYYLLNVGTVVIYYGTGERSQLTSKATLYYTYEDLSTKSEGESPYYKSESLIADERARQEYEGMTAAVANLGARQNTVALVDGTLILWAQDPKHAERRKKPAVSTLCELLTRCKEANAVPAGYISRPGSREVVNALQIALANGIVEGQSTSVELDKITDSDLFSKLLAPGERSISFASQAKVVEQYRPENNKIHFFYINTGWELARIEVPAWVDNNSAMVELLHAVIIEQVQKGNGYPVALIEAHELAVVRSSDQAAVGRLIEGELSRSQIEGVATRKQFAKRTRPI